MEGHNLDEKNKALLDDFVGRLKDGFKDNLLSVILYASGARGEFVQGSSDLNLLIVLKDASLKNLDAAHRLVRLWKFRSFRPLFFSEKTLLTSTDIFPIEFLDMKENYELLFGRDPLKDLAIDTRNLRFQCEHELKSKLISLRHGYIRSRLDKKALLVLLLRHFNSVLPVLKNVLRVKGKAPSFLREGILKEIQAEFPIDRSIWDELLAAKMKRIKIKPRQVDRLFEGFLGDLEKCADLTDKL
jgi:predicted nucleotidyltransferase